MFRLKGGGVDPTSGPIWEVHKMDFYKKGIQTLYKKDPKKGYPKRITNRRPKQGTSKGVSPKGDVHKKGCHQQG